MFAPEHTAKVFRKFAADGIQGWFGETPDEIGMPFWHTQLETYIAHKLADDPTQDSTQMINEFFTLYYGAAAVPMREFYRLIEDAAWEKSIYGSDYGGVQLGQNRHKRTDEKTCRIYCAGTKPRKIAGGKTASCMVRQRSLETNACRTLKL